MLFDAVGPSSTAAGTTGAIVVAALTSLAAVLVAVVSTRKGRSDVAPPPADYESVTERLAVIEYRLDQTIENRLTAVEREVGL